MSAVKLFAHLTPEVGLEYAQKMGITTIHPDDYNLAASLGGLTWELRLLVWRRLTVFWPTKEKADLHTVKRSRIETATCSRT